MKLNRKNNKKGFTIVELVIVIGVIGILSAILIPTFANLTSQAQEAAAKEEVQNAFTSYVMDAVDGYFGEYADMTADEKEDARPIASVSQNDAAVLRNNKWYTYDGGWKLTASNGTTLPANVTVEDLPTAYNDLFGEYNGCKVYNNKAA